LATLILVDHNMPGMGGIEFISEVRARHAAAPPKVIMVSGASSVAHAAAAKSAGADQVLLKPVFAADLLNAINALFAV
jgi:DNA-binding response OmpR family regulator